MPRRWRRRAPVSTPRGSPPTCRPERLSRFFVKGEHSYRVSKELRDDGRLRAAEPGQRPAVLPARPDQLSQSLHLSRAGGPGAAHPAAALRAARRRLPVPGQRRGHRAAGGSVRGGVDEVADLPPHRADAPRHGSSFPSPPHPSRPSRAGRPRVRRIRPGWRHWRSTCCSQRYAPACVIINRTGEILYFHGRTDDYLAQPSGLPTRDLIAQARSGLRTKLRGAIQEAIRDNQRVVLSGRSGAPRRRVPTREDDGRAARCRRHGGRGPVVGVLRRRTGDRCTGRRSHRRRGERRRRGPRAPARVRAEDHQGGSAADHRGPQSGERRADVGQRGVPVQQRGAGNLEGGAAIAQRGAHHRQHAAGGQDRRSWKRPTTTSTTC